jgi:hypothetical protein
MFASRFMPCPSCGVSVERSQSGIHRCDPERAVSYQMVALRAEIDSFEQRFRSYLDSTHGRFERWLVSRQLRREV